MSTGFDESEVPMFHRWHELSLAEALSDPMILAVMAADHVDPAALDTLLRAVAHRVEPDPSVKLLPYSGMSEVETPARH
jgi:hypothetical protein